MIRLISFLVLMACSIPGLYGQEYFVLQVKGIVKNTKTGKALKTGEVITADDKLLFSTATDAVAVVNPKSGRFVIKPGPAIKSNEFLAYVKDVLSQASSRLSTRAGGFNNPLDFQLYFKDTVLLLPDLKFKVNKERFPMSDTSFFFIRFQYRGEAINKKLALRPDSLVIKATELFAVDGKGVSSSETSDHALYFYRASGSMLICKLVFNNPEPASLRAEVDVLKNALTTSKTDAAKIREELISYLQENYGKVDVGNFVKWYEGN